LYRFPFLILFYNILLWSDTATEGQAYEYFFKAEYALLKNNYLQAELDFSKALLLAPDSPTILQSLVDLKTYQGEYGDAIKYLEKIIKLEPGNKEVGIKLLQLYIHEDKQVDAHELLTTLLQFYPSDIELLYAQADIQYVNQDWSNLIKTYHAIYLSDKENSDILLKIYEVGLATGHVTIVLNLLKEINIENATPLGLELLVALLSGKNEFSEAILYMKQLIEIDENTDTHTISLGELYLLNKQFDHVITTLEPIYQSGNHSLEVLRLLLIAYSTFGKKEEQIAISLILYKEYPELSIGYEAAAVAYLDAGDAVNAIHILHKALNKFPTEVSFPHTLANIYYQSKNFIEAEKYFIISLDLNPQMLAIQHTLATMYEDMADTDRSDSLFKMIIDYNENDAIGLNDYAYIICERKKSSSDDLNYALALAERAIDIEPDNSAFLDTIGWIYYKLDIYQKAKIYLEKSISINNNNPVILEHLGDIYVKLNKTLKAINIYEKVLLIDSDNQLIEEKINNIYE